MIGIPIGAMSYFFLVTLGMATSYREAHSRIILLLPLGGLTVAALYKYFGQEVKAGNNLLIDNIQKSGKTIPFKMAPFIYIGTIITHLFGGSAGREGTALQMAGAFADQLSKPLKLNSSDRQILLIAAIAAGFGAVFGTPLAGAVFALEFYLVGKIRYNAIFPAFITAIIADYTARAMGAPHSHFFSEPTLGLKPDFLIFSILSGVLFGLTAAFFSKTLHFLTDFFAKNIKNELLRPVIGGSILVVIILIWGNTKYLGLGVPEIENSFLKVSDPQDFILKLLLTTLTISAGFKGGEVTPLFFIGATLGSALAAIFPLPVALLAAMGFVAVFAGATNTPLACLIMGLELFGSQNGIYLATAVIVSYLFSGHTGIYLNQIIGEPKNRKLDHHKDKSLRELL
ncbi:MAG: chloride channel protein [Cytophagaceae bacterium]|nr:chloride channel protein [Cytophagaceae bacterium]